MSSVEVSREQLKEQLWEIASELLDVGLQELGLQGFERLVMEKSDEMGLLLLQHKVQQLNPTETRLHINGKSWHKKETRSCRYRSVMGFLQLSRSLYVCQQTGERLYPLDQLLGIEQRWTPLARQCCAQLVASMPAREAVTHCKLLCRMPYGHEVLRRKALELGEQLESSLSSLEEALWEQKPWPQRATSMSLSLDRVSLPLVEQQPQGVDRRKGPHPVVWRMVFCVCLQLADENGDILWSWKAASMPGQAEKLWQRTELLLEALESSSAGLRRVFLSDGAKEFDALYQRLCPGWQRAIDLYHLLEYLADALCADGKRPQGQLAAWKKQLLEEQGAIGSVLVQLDSMKLCDEVDSAFGYIESRLESMNYAFLANQGLPVASGAIESTCKQLVNLRFKRCGARFRGQGAQALLHLRAAYLSDDAFEHHISSLLKPAFNLDVEQNTDDRLCAA
jgi:hypothetical protein